jgi:hypothetical protein
VKNSFEKVTNLQGLFSSETLLAHVPFFKA